VKKVIMALLIILGITLIVVVLSVKTFPEWLTIPGGILILLGLAFNAVLDVGTKIKGWVDLLFPSETNHLTSEQKKEAKPRISASERTKDNSSQIEPVVYAIQQEQSAKTLPFTVMDRTIRCATVEGLILLKIFALPSLYRQGSFERVGIYENDIATLMNAFNPTMEPLFKELVKHLNKDDIAEAQNIVSDIEARIQRFRKANK
jgi:hypothetical protein